MIVLTRSGAVTCKDSVALSRFRRQFEENHCVQLRQLVGPDLMQLVLNLVERTKFEEREHDGIGDNKELCATQDDLAVAALTMLLNNQDAFHVIESITGCERIRSFGGRLYRVCPGMGHHDAWHDDIGDHRLVALSINLSRQVFTGGLLQIRDCDTEILLQEAPNTALGDAVVFRLAQTLEHRISDIEGAVCKTAFAGWFKSQPEYSVGVGRDS